MLVLFFISGRYRTAKLDLSMSQMGHFRPRQRTLPPAHFRFAPKADVWSK